QTAWVWALLLTLPLTRLIAPAAQPPKFTTLTNQTGTPVSPATIRVRPLPAWISGSSAILPPAVGAATGDDESPRLEVAMRTAVAQVETLQLMTSDQRQAFKDLERQLGGAIQVRLRPGVGTPRLVALPKERATKLATIGFDPLAVANNFLQTNRMLLRLTD